MEVGIHLTVFPTSGLQVPFGEHQDPFPLRHRIHAVSDDSTF